MPVVHALQSPAAPCLTLLPAELSLLRQQVVKAQHKACPELADALQAAGADLLIQEYLRFMTVLQSARAAGHIDQLSPSLLVDEVWHAHVLCTRNYRAFCQRHFGQFVDHEPDDEEEQQKEQQEQGQEQQHTVERRSYDRCVQLYQQMFKTEPPLLAWRAQAGQPEGVYGSYCIPPCG